MPEPKHVSNPGNNEVYAISDLQAMNPIPRVDFDSSNSGQPVSAAHPALGYNALGYHVPGYHAPGYHALGYQLGAAVQRSASCVSI